MQRAMVKKDRRASRPSGKRAEQRTRQQLLEAAGQVFAEKGFDRSTGKEICHRAGANTAAVNYYFGGIEGLYAAALWEAHSRVGTVEVIRQTVSGKADAKAKLQSLLELFVRTVTGPLSSSWALRLIAREVVAPTAALEELREKQILPKVRIMRGIVGELMKLPEDHPAVVRGALCVLAPCIVLLLADRATLRRVFPGFGFGPEDAPAVARHVLQYALAGLSAVATQAAKD